MNSHAPISVWWINQFAISPNEPGGGRHIQLAQALKSLGCDSTIISSTKNYMTGNKGNSSAGSDSASSQIVQIPIGWRGPKSIGKYFRMVSFGKKVSRGNWSTNLQKPNLIIGSSPSLHAAVGALELAKRLKVPFIFEIRDLWPESLVQFAGISSQHPVIRRLQDMELTLVSESDAIISLLPGVSDYYASMGIQEDKFTCIPNGIDSQLFQSNENLSREVVKTIMYAGSHGPPNGLFTMIDAARILQTSHPQLRFRFIGDGTLKAKAQRHAERNGITSVVFENPIPRSDMPSVLGEADILMAHFEDLELYQYGISPNKIYEYMASAKPIVFATTAKDDPVTTSEAGPVVPPNNPEAMARRIVEIVDMTSQERTSLGMKGRAFVEKEHAFDTLAVKAFNLIQRVCSK